MVLFTRIEEMIFFFEKFIRPSLATNINWKMNVPFLGLLLLLIKSKENSCFGVRCLPFMEAITSKSVQRKLIILVTWLTKASGRGEKHTRVLFVANPVAQATRQTFTCQPLHLLQICVYVFNLSACFGAPLRWWYFFLQPAGKAVLKKWLRLCVPKPEFSRWVCQSFFLYIIPKHPAQTVRTSFLGFLFPAHTGTPRCGEKEDPANEFSLRAHSRQNVPCMLQSLYTSAF